MEAITTGFELGTKQKPDGRYPINLRISKGRKERKRISTKIYVFKNSFNSKARFGKWIRTSDSSNETLNNRLKQILKNVELVQYNLREKGININVVNIYQHLKNANISNQTFTEYFIYVKKLFKEAKKANTLRRYITAFDNFDRFMNGLPLRFEDINVGFLVRYQNYLEAKGLAVNTISKELAIFRAVLYRAIKEKLFPQSENPFLQFKLQKEKPQREKLTIEEVRRMESLNLLEGSKLFHVKNIFLFAMYNGGIRFGDMCRLKWDNIKDDGERLEYKMGKTSCHKNFTLLSKSKRILSYYQSHKNSDFVFPILPPEAIKYNEFEMVEAISKKNSYINRLLKDVAKEANISKRLSTHVCRHSFANIMRENGVSLYDIKSGLGHSSLSITEQYLASMDETSLTNSIQSTFE